MEERRGSTFSPDRCMAAADSITSKVLHVLILTNQEIEQVLKMDECMSILEEMYRDFAQGKALFMPRVDNILPCNHEGAYYGLKHMGGGWPLHKIMAMRVNSDIITHPSVRDQLRRVKVPATQDRWVGLVFLFSTETGELLAIFPDGVAQRMRVGATSGLGVKYLAREDSRRAGIIGSGWQAGAQILALLVARQIEEIKVFSLRKESRETFAREMSQRTGVKIDPVDSAEECVRKADIVLAATSSLVPVIRAEWLNKGMHVSCITSYEIDKPVLERCQRIVVHTKYQEKPVNNVLSGTEHVPAQYFETGIAPVNSPDLADLIVGREPARTDASEVTCFLNRMGLGLQFAALGTLILEKAKQFGLGKELPPEWFSEDVHP